MGSQNRLSINTVIHNRAASIGKNEKKSSTTKGKGKKLNFHLKQAESDDGASSPKEIA